VERTPRDLTTGTSLLHDGVGRGVTLNVIAWSRAKQFPEVSTDLHAMMDSISDTTPELPPKK
jgi:hypothetical protein